MVTDRVLRPRFYNIGIVAVIRWSVSVVNDPDKYCCLPDTYVAYVSVFSSDIRSNRIELVVNSTIRGISKSFREIHFPKNMSHLLHISEQYCTELYRIYFKIRNYYLIAPIAKRLSKLKPLRVHRIFLESCQFKRKHSCKTNGLYDAPMICFYYIHYLTEEV